MARLSEITTPGTKIRRKHWLKNTYIIISEDKNIQYETSIKKKVRLTLEDLQALDWEIFNKEELIKQKDKNEN